MIANTWPGQGLVSRPKTLTLKVGKAALGVFFTDILEQKNVKGILAAPPKATPPSNKGLIRPY